MLSKIRDAYMASCTQSEVSPSISFMTQLKNCAETEMPLTRVNITHGSSGDKQVAAIKPVLALVPIPHIALNYVALTDEGVRELLTLSYCNPISSLELFGNQLGDHTCDCLLPLLGMQKLVHLKLGDNFITDKGASILANGLVNQTSLIQLHLGGNKLGDAGLIAIVNALQYNCTLTSLGMRHNQIGALGMKHLAQHLCRDNCVLGEIHLRGNVFGDEGAKYLAEALTCNRTLRVLEVQENTIGPLGGTHLCLALRHNTTVNAVNFNDNSLADEGAEAIAALLWSNSVITTVGLSGNKVELRGTKAIAAALATNTALTGLDLGNNCLGDAGVIALVETLRDRNKTLVSLDLHHNNIHVTGTVALASMMLENNTLRNLDFGSNLSRDPGACAWAQVIRHSTTLTRLCLTDNEIGKRGGEKLMKAIKFNSTLRHFQFLGQSQTSPLANRINSEHRRIMNNVVAHNKRVYEAEQAQLQSKNPSKSNPIKPNPPGHAISTEPLQPRPVSVRKTPGRVFWDQRTVFDPPPQPQASPAAGQLQGGSGEALLSGVPDYPRVSTPSPTSPIPREELETGFFVPVPTLPSLTKTYTISAPPPRPHPCGWSPFGLVQSKDQGDCMKAAPSQPASAGGGPKIGTETYRLVEHTPLDTPRLSATPPDPQTVDYHALKNMLATLQIPQY